jgi:hypothetical protein
MGTMLASFKSHNIFLFELAARAGCNQVFLEVESVNRENLRSKDKFQNQVSEYKDLVAHCHAGYILGLPFDTPESINQDISELQRMKFDSASFYILSPLPGSKDHQRWWLEGRRMDKDFNTYDSAHVAVKPERMSCDELLEAYHNAWEQFYSTKHMVDVLKIWRHNHYYYRERLAFFMWYLYASRIERLHPMNCGFWTVRHRNDRWTGFTREAFIPFWLKRVNVIMFRLGEMVKLFSSLKKYGSGAGRKVELKKDCRISSREQRKVSSIGGSLRGQSSLNIIINYRPRYRKSRFHRWSGSGWGSGIRSLKRFPERIFGAYGNGGTCISGIL